MCHRAGDGMPRPKESESHRTALIVVIAPIVAILAIVLLLYFVGP
jgi:hypothetical protein